MAVDVDVVPRELVGLAVVVELEGVSTGEDDCNDELVANDEL